MVALSSAASAQPRARVVHAGGSWAALDRGASCEALSASLKRSGRPERGTLAVAFDWPRRQWGTVRVQLSRAPRAGSTVLLRAGGAPFLLTWRGRWAWSVGPAQDRALVAALRSAANVRVDARDERGRRFSDHYPGQGAPTAIDSAAAACAGKIPRS